MNLLFVGVAPFTYGEVALLLNFADAIPGRATFVVGAHHASLVRERGHDVVPLTSAAPDSGSAVREIIRAHTIEAIVVPDLLSLWYARPFFGLDLEFWFALDLPLVSLDSHAWPLVGLTMDLGGVPYNPTDLSADAVAAFRERLAGTISICPFRSPSRVDRDRAVAMYRSVGGHRDPAQVRAAVGCGNAEKLVLLVGLIDRSRAEESNRPVVQSLLGSRDGLTLLQGMVGVGRAIQGGGAVFERLLHMILLAAFQRVSARLRVVSVSHMLAAGAVDERWDGGTWSQVGMMSETDFDELVRAADLVISANEVSGAMMKAVLAGTPAIAVVNSRGAPGELETRSLPEDARALLRGSPLLYRWRYFPVGLFDYYEPLLAGNDVAGTYARVELFDPAGLTAAIDRLLHDADAIDGLRGRQEAYRREVVALDGPAEVFARLDLGSG